MSIQKKQTTLGMEDLGDRMIRFIASTEEEDRDGDILVANGCDFTNFAKNPQFLGFHNSWDFPLGVPKNWGVDQMGKRVFIDVYFPTVAELSTDPNHASEKAKLVDFTYKCYSTGMLKAVSVGFLIKNSEKNAGSDKPWAQIIRKWELLELSAVPLPANANALAAEIKSFDPSGKTLVAFGLDGIEPETKSGRRLSAATMKEIEELKGCHERIKACHKELDDRLTKLMDGANSEPEEPEDDDVLEIVD